jgi:hypothetical protein
MKIPSWTTTAIHILEVQHDANSYTVANNVANCGFVYPQAHIVPTSMSLN